MIELLNEYFEAMIDAIFAHGGTLVSYHGDGLLTVFGAAIEVDDHADRALAAAREMLELRLPHFNRWLREQGLGDGFAIGIGLNSGHFMSGNVGSARRLEYTVHGDTVNTAARLQEMTKSARRSILIAESTRRALLSPPGELAYVGEFDVRGRQSTIRLGRSPRPAPRLRRPECSRNLTHRPPGWESVPGSTQRSRASSSGA